MINIDGGLTYFLISATWIQKWRDFITLKGPVPGPIENRDIAEKIYMQRAIEKVDWYKVHDNHVAMKENEEAYTLSHDFWQMFNSRYSCDMVVQIRKYNDVNKLVKEPIDTGDVWSAMAV